MGINYFYLLLLLLRVVTTIAVSRGMLGWISHVSIVGICYNSGISDGILVLLQWSPFSISNKQYTTQSAAVRVVQKDIWYGVVIILWVGIIHNNISIVEILLYLLQRFSLWKRRDMDNTQQYTINNNIQQHTNNTTTIWYWTLYHCLSD